MSKNSRAILISIVTFLGGIYFFLEFILPEKIFGFEFGLYHEQISRGLQTIGAMSFALGLINILMVHGSAVVKGRRGWINSTALLFGMLVMLVCEGLDFYNSEQSVADWQAIAQLTRFSQAIAKDHPVEEAQQHQRAVTRLAYIHPVLSDARMDAEHGLSYLSYAMASQEKPEMVEKLRSALLETRATLDLLIEARTKNCSASECQAAQEKFENTATAAGQAAQDLAMFNLERSKAKRVSQLLYQGFFVPLGAAMFSLLAFYIATAAYRTFRVRSLEAAIMMFAALLVMLGQMAHGPLIYANIANVRLWLLLNLSTPAFRAIYFGATIAGLAMAVRMWLSLERAPLAEEVSTGDPGK